MRIKVTLALLLANVALFVCIFFFERGRGAEQAALENRNRVFGPEAADIGSLAISGQGTTFRLERAGDAWSLVEPLKWPANAFAVSRILNELQFLEHDTQFSVEEVERNGQGLADYGLAEPRLTLTFTSAAAPAPVTVRLGQDTAVGNRLYLLVEGTDHIHVVRRSLADTLALSLTQLRSDAIFTIPVFELRSATLQSTAGARVRLRRDQNRWMLEAPIIARADKTRVELALNELNALRVAGFLADADPEATRFREELARPLHRITLEGNNRRETLLIGPAHAKAPNGVTRYIVQLEGRDQLFAVDLTPELAKTLTNAATELRDKHVLDFDPARVTAITIASPADQSSPPELNLQRLDTGVWQIMRRAGDNGQQTLSADAKLVENLLKRLTLLEAAEFAVDVPSDAQIENFGFKLPERTVTLSLINPSDPAAPATTLTLEIAQPNRGTDPVYARVAGQTFVYRVPADILVNTPVSALVYRDRLLRNLTTGASITSLSLRSADGSTEIFAHTLAEGETWDQVLGKQPLERRQALAALLTQLRELRAEGIVQDNFPETVIVNGVKRPWAWRLDNGVLEAGGEGEPEQHTLFIAERGGGGTQQVGSPRLDLVFNAGQPLIDALWTLLYGERDPGPAKETPAAEAPVAAP